MIMTDEALVTTTAQARYPRGKDRDDEKRWLRKDKWARILAEESIVTSLHQERQDLWHSAGAFRFWSSSGLAEFLGR